MLKNFIEDETNRKPIWVRRAVWVYLLDMVPRAPRAGIANKKFNATICGRIKSDVKLVTRYKAGEGPATSARSLVGGKAHAQSREKKQRVKIASPRLLSQNI